MNTSDERQFSARLSAVLDDYAPPPLPLDDVLGKGRAVKVRRRVTAVLAALAAVVVAVATPAAFTALTGPVRPTALAHYHDSVSPPGSGAKEGEIATGRIDRLRWTVSVTYDVRTTNLCFSGLGAANCGGSVPTPPLLSASPIQEEATISNRPILDVWSVRSDVTLVAVDLSNGKKLALHPVAALGRAYPRFIALGAPSAASVTRISAYSASGEVAYAVPFTRDLAAKADDGLSADVRTPRWLKPGQPALPLPVTYTIGSGVQNGQRWAEHLYLGPWGTCVDGAGYGGFCFGQEGVALLRGKPARRLATAYVDRTTGYVAVVASREVSYLKLRTAGDGSVKVIAVHAAGISFAAYVTSPARKVLRWTAYSAAGTVIGEGT